MKSDAYVKESKVRSALKGLSWETLQFLLANNKRPHLSVVISECSVPQFIRSDNGPEFISKEVPSCFEEMGIGTIYIDPGSPWQNGHVQSFSQLIA